MVDQVAPMVRIVGVADGDGTDISTAEGVRVHGSVASAATDAGAPIKVGAVYNSTAPTYTNGQRSDAQADTRGNLKVTLLAPDAASTAFAANNADAVATSGQQVYVRTVSQTYSFNGSTWDRAAKPNTVARIASAAASTNATAGKAAAGSLHTVSGYNAAATVRYLKVYNKATAPVVGTDVPVLTLALAPTAAFSFSWGNGGLYFSTGIAFALTTGAADADTGALTAADVVGLNLAYS